MTHYAEMREYMSVPDDKETIRQLERRNNELQEYNSVLEKQVDSLLKAIALYREELDKHKPAS
jgi:DNA-binding transcriptional MerR regulator